MATARQNGPEPHHGVREKLEPVVAALGLIVEDVVVSTAGSRRLLRVVLDLPQDHGGQLALDVVAEAARKISAALDAADPMGQTPYTLEVSSPGVERPLTQPRHLRRNVGRIVLLTLREGDTATGRVMSVEDDDAIVLLLAGPKKGMPATKLRRVEWAEVVQGVVQVEFNRPDGRVPDDTELLGDDESDDLSEGGS